MTRDVARERLCVALDVSSFDRAIAIVEEIHNHVGVFKVGMELYTAEGPRVVDAILMRGAKIFLDLKFHDIPNTVAGAVRSAVRLGVSFVDVHSSGGSDMMRAAAMAASEEAAIVGGARPRVLAITVLTSISEEVLRREARVDLSVMDCVLHLAQLAKDSGIDGVVSSPRESGLIRQACGPDFVVVTPGVRPLGIGKNDQSRVATPREAIMNGADIIVVGRPIIDAADRVAACEAILREMSTDVLEAGLVV